MGGGKPLVVNGWTLFAHPILLDQLDVLTEQVEALKRKHPEDTKRTYDSSDDAYRVFRRMLDSGRLPSDWMQLLGEAGAEAERPVRLASGASSSR